MRVKTEYRTTSAETYKRFCAANPEIHLTYEAWKKIIYTYNYVVRDYILESGDKAKMPFGVGIFAIAKWKVKKHKIDPWGREWVNLPIDWKKSKAAGKHIYNFNSHSDGYRYKWKWFQKNSRFYLSTIWNFKPYRDSSRKLAQYLKRLGSKYSEIYNEW